MKLLTILIFLFPILSHGQQLDRYVIATQGDFDRGESITVSWTIGELFTESVIQRENTITQGFQQPDFVVSRMEQSKVKDLQVTLYPNPNRGKLTLKMKTPSDQYRVEIVDMMGRILYQAWHSDLKVNLDMNAYASGQYVIRVSDPATKKQTSYSIIKL